MRVLILGGAGMLGHKLCQVLNERFDVWVTLRAGYSAAYKWHGLFDPARVVSGVDAHNFDAVTDAIAAVQPDVVINAIGIFKQTSAAQDPLTSLKINSLFPHRLGVLCQATGIRLIHISTDCVFSGVQGNYTEKDTPDPEDLYGRSKLMGEINSEGQLTLRTSIIGRELEMSYGLVEWFLSNDGDRVQGYTDAVFTGFPTLILARIIEDIIEQHRNLSGLYHVSSEPITKYELLCLLKDAYQIHVDIEPSADMCIDRSLDSSNFRTAIGFTPPTWTQMVEEMANDSAPYEDWRVG